MVTEKDQRERGLGNTVREISSEMKKVVWPTREETTRLTILVILVSAVAGLILFAADYLFYTLILLLRGAVGG